MFFSPPNGATKPARIHQKQICRLMYRGRRPREIWAMSRGGCPEAKMLASSRPAPKSTKLNDPVKSGLCPAKGAQRPECKPAAAQPGNLKTSTICSNLDHILRRMPQKPRFKPAATQPRNHVKSTIWSSLGHVLRNLTRKLES